MTPHLRENLRFPNNSEAIHQGPIQPNPTGAVAIVLAGEICPAAERPQKNSRFFINKPLDFKSKTGILSGCSFRLLGRSRLAITRCLKLLLRLDANHLLRSLSVLARWTEMLFASNKSWQVGLLLRYRSMQLTGTESARFLLSLPALFALFQS